MQYAKAMKEIDNRKRKERKQNKKIEKGLGEPLGPDQKSSPQPSKRTEPVRCLSSLPTLTLWPHQSGRTHRSDRLLPPSGNLAGERFLAVNSPSLIHFNTCRFFPAQRTYKSPRPPLLFPSSPSCKGAARLPQ
jgi:hypothetical protein